MESYVAQTAKAFRIILGVFCDSEVCEKHGQMVQQYCTTAEAHGLPAFLEIVPGAPTRIGTTTVCGYKRVPNSDEFQVVEMPEFDAEKTLEYMHYIIRDSLWCWKCHHTLYHMCMRFAKTGAVDLSYVTYLPPDVIISPDPTARRNILINSCRTFDITAETETLKPAFLAFAKFEGQEYAKFHSEYYEKFCSEKIFGPALS
jgi:hypothetical protein